MLRTLLVTILLITAVGCTSKSPPPTAKNDKLEALQNDAGQINRFIDNWSGFDQQFSRISYPKQVFGRSFKLSIPTQAIPRPELPESFLTRQPGSD